MGGVCKHKNSWAVKYAPGYFGKHGFVRRNCGETPVAHLYAINQKALCNELEKKEGKFHFDFEGKVLATGKVTVPLAIRAGSWSKSVEKKVAGAGGTITKLAPQKPAS